MTETQLLISVLIIMLATQITRFLPFIIFGGKRKTPKFVEYLGKTLPYAAVALLVVYCFKGVSFTEAASYAPMLIGIAITAALHLWRSNTLLSIAGGTVSYMLLVQFVF